MTKENRKLHNHIDCFNPDVILLECAYQDFLSEIESFNAGPGYENFNDFISHEATQYKNDGNGVTYTVWIKRTYEL